jgi:hypothetical protein
MLAATFNLEYIADIAFILVMLIWAIVDAKKGFINCFFSFVTAIVCTLAVLFLSAPVLEWTGGLFGLEGIIQGGLGDWLSTIKPFDIDVSMKGWEAYLEEMQLPDFLMEALLAEIEGFVGDIPAGTLLGQFMGNVVGSFLSIILYGIAVFIIVKLIMLLLRGLLNKVVCSCKFFEKINLLGGLVAGAFKGFAVVCIVLALLSLITVPEISAFFDKTLILNGLYHDNPVLVVFSWFVVA